MAELDVGNPRHRFFDFLPARLKIFIKLLWKYLLGEGYWQVVIPPTKRHPAWVLGAQPNRWVINTVSKSFHNSPVSVVSMLTRKEQVLSDQSKAISKIYRFPWFDHGVINLNTGLNQETLAMIELQKELVKDFKANSTSVFYCHCMAGKYRSYVETLAFMFFYPNKSELFDFDDQVWARLELAADFKACLVDYPNFSELAKLVKLRRPEVSGKLKLESDQAGLLGLLMLNQLVTTEMLSNRRFERIVQDAQNVGLMLKAPLDPGLRSFADVVLQERNFQLAIDSFSKLGINLPMIMITPCSKKSFTVESATQEFDRNFNGLTANEQLRFLVLLKKVKQQAEFSLPREFNFYLLKVVRRANELSAGDALELAKNFGFISKLDVKWFVDKILLSKEVDYFSRGILLAELVYLVWDQELFSANNLATINNFDDFQKNKFIKHLACLQDHRVEEYARSLGVILPV
jgi:hypothetical protein